MHTMSEWRSMDTAPKTGRILAWCEAAESEHGVIEMEWYKNRWVSVVSHPYTNACLNPKAWMPTVTAPVKEMYES